MLRMKSVVLMLCFFITGIGMLPASNDLRYKGVPTIRAKLSKRF